MWSVNNVKKEGFAKGGFTKGVSTKLKGGLTKVEKLKTKGQLILKGLLKFLFAPKDELPSL